MSTAITVLLLTLAALLEVLGDAFVRSGLNAKTLGLRMLWLGLGAVVLLVYGVTVNGPRWDFGRLLGVYVALFFVCAQLVSWLWFGQRPGLPILVGGALIVCGGAVITFWRT